MTASQVAALDRVDILKDPRCFAVLDEGCNRTCHGKKWIENAIEKLEKLGKPVGGLTGPPKTYSGLGNTKTAGRRKIPWGTLLSNWEHIGGSLTSNEIVDSPNLPLLLSLGAQSTLGLQKDTRKGTCYIPDMGAFVKLYEVVGSELRAICISEFYDVPDPVTPTAMQPEDSARLQVLAERVQTMPRSPIPTSWVSG